MQAGPWTKEPARQNRQNFPYRINSSLHVNFQSGHPPVTNLCRGPRGARSVLASNRDVLDTLRLFSALPSATLSSDSTTFSLRETRRRSSALWKSPPMPIMICEISRRVSLLRAAPKKERPGFGALAQSAEI